MQYTIGANQANKIKWLASGKILAAGTSKDIYKLSASNLDEAITPLNRRIVREVSNKGVAYTEPISIDNIALYISWSRRKLREFTYNFENEYHASSTGGGDPDPEPTATTTFGTTTPELLFATESLIFHGLIIFFTSVIMSLWMWKLFMVV